jgi:hypothetical protein
MMILEIFGFLSLSAIDILDILMVAVILYVLFRWIRGSSAMNIFMAIVLLLIVLVIVGSLNMKLMTSLMDTLFDVGLLALIIIFQPEIRHFLLLCDSWIRKNRERILALQEEQAAVPKLTEAEVSELKKRAKKVFAERAAYYAPRIGVTYGRITVTTPKSKWGSCTGKGNLSFHALLLLAPPQVLDSVVVHELCHLKEMNHSPRFWAEVEKVLPQYRQTRNWLKLNGPAILARMPSAE